MGGATSILFRLRRTTHEDCYVTVPVTSLVMSADGSGLDVELLKREAIKLGTNSTAEWKIEEQSTDLNPTQQPLPAGRTAIHGLEFLLR